MTDLDEQLAGSGDGVAKLQVRTLVIVFFVLIEPKRFRCQDNPWDDSIAECLKIGASHVFRLLCTEHYRSRFEKFRGENIYDM